MEPKVSIIVATYCSGDGLDRLVGSLDAQTMPQDEFEVIFVDDGSPDDTVQVLERLCASRPNHQVISTAASGWPSRPRNVGIEAARGEYVMFMDHDDTLYPDGLRRVHQFAREHDADFVSPKESKTSDAWWQMQHPNVADVPDVRAGRGVADLMPFVPHKIYRRAMLMRHGIRFREGGRVLWEDILFNVDALRHAGRSAHQADSPFYLWHETGSNTTGTFNPSLPEYHERLDDVMGHITSALAGDDHRADRTFLLAHQVTQRIISRTMGLRRQAGDTPESRGTFERACRLARRYVDDDVLEALSPWHRVLALVFLSGRLDLLDALIPLDGNVGATVSTRQVSWSEGRLEVSVDARITTRRGDGPALLRNVDGRVRLALPEPVEREVGTTVLDVTRDLGSMAVQGVLRGRQHHVSWPVVFQGLQCGHEGTDDVRLAWRGHATIDPSTAAAGHPVPDDVYDARVRVDVLGIIRKPGLKTRTASLPAVISGRSMVAYSNAKGELSVDLTGDKRTLAIDGWPRRGVAGGKDAFVAPLERVSAWGASRLPARIAPMGLVGTDAPPPPPVPAASAPATSRVPEPAERFQAVVEVSGQQVMLAGSTTLPAGTYQLHAEREGQWHRTDRQLVIDDEERVVIV